MLRVCLSPWPLWAALVWLLHGPVQATDLLSMFRQAQTRDATYLGALASREASEELIPQARASLLPNASFSALRMNNRLDKTDGNSNPPTQLYASNNRTLAVRQPLWRPAATAQLELARLQTQGAHHELQRSNNELALRIATAYMDALYADDQRKTALTQVRQLRQQLVAAQQAFGLGYGTRVDVDETQARLEQAQAEVTQLESSGQYAREQLALFSGASDPVALNDQQIALSLGTPLAELSHWLERGVQTNPEARLARIKLQAAQQDVQKFSAGHLPTLDVVAQVSNSSNENIQFPSVSYVNKQIGIQLNVPLLSGGATQSAVRQAIALAQREEHLLQATLINIRLQITREYTNLTDGQSRMQANLSAHRAAQHTLRAMENNFQAGYRTRLDVLNALQRVATTEKDLMLSRYQTLLAWLKLQLQSGTPAEEAIARLLTE